jgi:hypothetical protein
MKILKVVLLLLIPFAAHSQQCPPPDTTIGTGQFYFLDDPSPNLALTCAPCTVAVGSHYSIDVVSTSIHNRIKLGANMSLARYTILDSTCRLVLYDTCGEWDATANVWLEDSILTGKKFRINILTEGTGTTQDVGVHVFTAVGGAIPSVDSCRYIDPVTGGKDPVYWEFDGIKGSRTQALPPLRPGFYMEYETYPRRCRMILVR